MAIPLTDAQCLEALRALEEHGTRAEAARQIGLHVNTFKSRLDQATRRGLHLSLGARESMAGSGLDGLEMRGGHRRYYDSEGRHIDTVRYTVPKLDADATESLLERARAIFEDLPAASPVAPPERSMADLCTLYPLFDVHLGMHAWGRETGGHDYDLKLAVADLKKAMGDVMAWSPDSQRAIVLIGGDFFHADDDTNQTPRSRHPLDVDGRHFKILDTGIEAIAHLIETALAKHESVHVRVMRGNHDEHAHMALTFALAQRYREEPRVTIEKEPRDLFMYQHGKCMIAAHHGDKAKPQPLVMMLAEVCPFWSASPHRIVFTGHVHHDQVKDFPGIRWESLRAFCPPDAFGAQFAPRRAMQAITFHVERGIVLRATDPIMRAA